MKTKAKTSKKSRSAGRNAGRKQPKRRSMGKSRRSRRSTSKETPTEAIAPSLVEEAPITAQQAEPLLVDKRDDELTDEESLDREERQELY